MEMPYNAQLIGVRHGYVHSNRIAALDDLETVRKLFLEQYPDKFYLHFSAFDAQEEMKTVLYYIRNTYLTIAQSPEQFTQ